VKTLAEIAIEAGLVTKAGAAKAGRMAEERKEPLVVVLIKELGVNEVALIGALRKQTRVPLLDPAQVEVDPEALRIVPRDSCARLRVLPLGLSFDGKTRVLRVAMADPTDTSAILELEVIANCEIEVTALPLSAIDELVDKGYKQFTTLITRTQRPTFGNNLAVTTKQTRVPMPIDGSESAGASEVSVTAQIPLAMLVPAPDFEMRFVALCQVLVAKGLVTEAELADALRKLDATKPSES
jgi:Type II secretion system (T2SS), protein E, N-terminal domain